MYLRGLVGGVLGVHAVALVRKLHRFAVGVGVRR